MNVAAMRANRVDRVGVREQVGEATSAERGDVVTTVSSGETSETATSGRMASSMPGGIATAGPPRVSGAAAG